MIGSFKFDAGIQNIILLFIVLGVGAFLYLEMRKITIDLDRIKKRVDDMSRDSGGDFVSLKGNVSSSISPNKPSHQTSHQTSQLFQKSAKIDTKVKENEVVETRESLRSLMMSSDSPKDIQGDEISPDKIIIEEDSITDLEVGLPSRDDPIKDVAEPLRDVAEPLRAVAEPLREEPLREEPLREEPLREEPLREEPLKDSGFSEDIKIITQDQDPYQVMTVSELKAILQEKGLPLSGNKTKLINRIKENVNVEKK